MIIQFRLIITILLTTSFLSCIIVSKKGHGFNAKKKEPGKLKLENVKIRQSWGIAGKKVPILLAGIPKSTPEKYIINSLPPIGNQGKQLSGTAWASGYAAMSSYFHQRGKIYYICSPAFVYNLLNQNDTGIEILRALQLLKSTGCAEEKYMPYNHRSHTSKPGDDAIKNAINHRIMGYGRVDYTDVDQVRAHLLQNSVVIVILRITRSFLLLKGKAWATPEGFYVGRHSVAVIGYDNIKKEFIIQNSAGKKWGKNGYARIPYAWFVRMVGQAFVIW